MSALFVLAAAVAAAQSSPPQKENMTGVRNYTRVDATVACGGATTPDAFPELKRRGFVSVINLRTAAEPDANVEAAAEAARAAGITYIHIPITSGSPEPAQVDEFLKAVANPANQPVYIHCGSANRVGAVWLIKRVRLDGWDVDRATKEAELIGLTNPALKTFALEYLKAHGK